MPGIEQSLWAAVVKNTFLFVCNVASTWCDWSHQGCFAHVHVGSWHGDLPAMCLCANGQGHAFLAAFSKTFGESALLGEEYMRLVTHFDFNVPGNLLPCFRVAMLAAQLTSNKVVDKISKLLVKGDFDRLKSKCKPQLQEAESLLAKSWQLVEQAKHLEEFKRLSVFGRLCIRVVLFVCQNKDGQRKHSLGVLPRDH